VTDIKSTKGKRTEGEWFEPASNKACPDMDITVACIRGTLCTVHTHSGQTREQASANAKLIVDAGTVASRLDALGMDGHVAIAKLEEIIKYMQLQRQITDLNAKMPDDPEHQELLDEEVERMGFDADEMLHSLRPALSQIGGGA